MFRSGEPAGSQPYRIVVMRDPAAPSALPRRLIRHMAEQALLDMISFAGMRRSGQHDLRD